MTSFAETLPTLTHKLTVTSVNDVSFVQYPVNNALSMPFTEEDKIIIKHYRQVYGWGSQKILTQLGGDKNWTRVGIQYHIQKIDSTGSHERIKGSGRPRSARTDENKEEVEELITTLTNNESGRS